MQSQPLEITLPIVVRTYDIDFAGIVSNIVYIRWLEDLRTELLSAYFPFEECVRLGVAPVILHAAIDYHRAVRMFDDLIGRVWVVGMGKTRWEVAAEFVSGDQLMISARQRGCFIRLDNGRPAPIPEPMVRQWREWEASGRLPERWGR